MKDIKTILFLIEKIKNMILLIKTRIMGQNQFRYMKMLSVLIQTKFLLSKHILTYFESSAIIERTGRGIISFNRNEVPHLGHTTKRSFIFDMLLK